MIVAIDVGLKRIGVAFGYKKGKIVLPQNPILRKNRLQAADEVRELLAVNGCTKLVVGVPIGSSSEDEMGRRIRHFVGLIKFEGEVVYVDESFSSIEASEIYHPNSKTHDGRLDSVAAAVILNRYFDGCVD